MSRLHPARRACAGPWRAPWLVAGGTARGGGAGVNPGRTRWSWLRELTPSLAKTLLR